MNKKITVLTLSALLFALSVPAHAQQTKKNHRIGYLSSVDPAADAPVAEPIRRALRELGYIEGKNIFIEYRYGTGRRDRATELAGELVRLNVELIVVAGGEPWVRATMNAAKSIPIIMNGAGIDPVKEGFVESLARPGGNVTGPTSLNTELGGKRLELLKESAAKIARVAVLYDPSTGATDESKQGLPIAARALGMNLRSWEIRDEDGFKQTFAALNKDRPDGLYALLAGQLMRANIKRITDFALISRLPATYTQKEAVDAGGLMYYGADVVERYRRVAYYVDKILKGAKPAELPVEQPTKFELVINLKTAKQIDLTIPQSLLYRADRIIK
jgi:putative tryptophan/tyrosine transport system substrate-binding protein